MGNTETCTKRKKDLARLSRNSGNISGQRSIFLPQKTIEGRLEKFFSNPKCFRSSENPHVRPRISRERCLSYDMFCYQAYSVIRRIFNLAVGQLINVLPSKAMDLEPFCTVNPSDGGQGDNQTVVRPIGFQNFYIEIPQRRARMSVMRKVLLFWMTWMTYLSLKRSQMPQGGVGLSKRSYNPSNIFVRTRLI